MTGRVYSVEEMRKRNLLTEDDVRAIRDSQERNRLLALHYEVSEQTIWDIRARRTWKHI